MCMLMDRYCTGEQGRSQNCEVWNMRIEHHKTAIILCYAEDCLLS